MNCGDTSWGIKRPLGAGGTGLAATIRWTGWESCPASAFVQPRFAPTGYPCDNSRMRRVLPLLIAAAALLAACGGGGDSTTPTPTIDFEAAAEQAAAEALMTIDDLPQFWSPGTADDENVELELPPDCDVFDPDVGFPGAAAIDQSPIFIGSGETQASFLTAVFREEATAEDAIEGQDDLVDRCFDIFLEAIEQAARDEAADRGFELGPLAAVDVDLQETDFVQLGDQTQARRASVSITVTFISTDFDVDIIVVRSGRVAGVMTYSNFQFIDEDEEEEIARTMLAKLEAADASLPE